MPQTRECDYCGADIEPGTGTMFVRTNGTTIHFCSSKCEKNADLGREARDLSWTEAGRGTGGGADDESDEPAESKADVVEDDETEPDGDETDETEAEADEPTEADA